MKKSTVLCFLLLIFFGSASAGSFQIQAPQAGEVWQTGNSYDIKWVHTHSFPVDIKLYSDTDRWIANIESHFLPTAGVAKLRVHQLNWFIPTNLPSGKYKIKFFRSHSRMTIGTSGVFSIHDSRGIRPRPMKPDFELVDIGFNRHSTPPYQLWMKVRNRAGHPYLKVERFFTKFYRNGHDCHMDSWPVVEFRGNAITHVDFLVFFCRNYIREKSVELGIEVNADRSVTETDYTNNRKSKTLFFTE